MFDLTKWYLDVVTDDGTALIAYAIRLDLGPATLRFAATQIARPGSESVDRTAVAGVVLPETDAPGDVVRFRHEGLGVDGTWRRLAPPVGGTLLDDAAGLLRWDCVLPAADVEVALGGETLRGRGYAERLTMKRPPWSLPLRHLRWGRFVSESHAAVWIAWSGGEPKSWTWVDGAPAPDAVATDTSVTGLGRNRGIRIESFRELCDRRAMRVVSKHLPEIGGALLGPLADLREIKRLDRGEFAGGGATERGWVIHEVVAW
jgi:hypothetical protein